MLIQSNEKIELDIARCNLRGKISSLMDQKGMMQKDIAEATGIHATTLNKILKNDDPRPMSLEHLNLISDTLGLKKGELYYDFVSECIDSNGKYKVAKCEEFIMCCYEADLPLLAKAITYEILNQDVKSNKDLVLRISDKLYEMKLYDFALELYNEIIKEEQKKSEKLAICYFKKFMILRDQDLQGKGKEALHRLLDYLILLPDEFIEKDGELYNVKLDAYYRTLTFFNVMEDWENLLDYAIELESISLSINKEKYHAPYQKYIGESLIYQAYAYRGMEKYEESLLIIERYAAINDYFKNIAIGNKSYTLIEKGDCSAINDYIDWANEQDPKNLYYVLPLAVECYLKHGMPNEASNLINKYKNIIDQFSEYDYMLIKKSTLRLRSALAKYYSELKNSHEAINQAIECLILAVEMGQMKRFREGTKIIYKNNFSLNNEQRQKFESLLEGR
ncbi:XRE family transcriptional regulator [Brevibacillus brevis X23]|nr:XRE family transcriptional regulator [Brevibacillus brevis X23]